MSAWQAQSIQNRWNFKCAQLLGVMGTVMLVKQTMFGVPYRLMLRIHVTVSLVAASTYMCPLQLTSVSLAMHALYITTVVQYTAVCSVMRKLSLPSFALEPIFYFQWTTCGNATQSHNCAKVNNDVLNFSIVYLIALLLQYVHVCALT